MQIYLNSTQLQEESSDATWLLIYSIHLTACIHVSCVGSEFSKHHEHPQAATDEDGQDSAASKVAEASCQRSPGTMHAIPNQITSDLAIMLLCLRMCWTMAAAVTSPSLGMHGMAMSMAYCGESIMIWVTPWILNGSSRLGLSSGLRNLMTCGNLGQVTWFISYLLFICMFVFCFGIQHLLQPNILSYKMRLGDEWDPDMWKWCQQAVNGEPCSAYCNSSVLPLRLEQPHCLVFFTACKLRCLGWPGSPDSEGSWSWVRVCKESAT